MHLARYTFAVSLTWLITIAANVALLALMCHYRPSRSGFLWASQVEALVSTAVILTAQWMLSPDHGRNDALFNTCWTLCDLADAWAEAIAIFWVIRADRGSSLLGRVTLVGLGMHLYIKLSEYWAYDAHDTAWEILFTERQWINVFNILALCALVYIKSAKAHKEHHMTQGITKAEALAKLLASEFAEDAEAIAEVLFPEAFATADDDGDNGAGPRQGGGH